MKINNISEGSIINLVVSDSKNRKVTFTTTSVHLKDDITEEGQLAVTAIKSNNVLIKFDYGNCTAYIEDNADGKSYKYPLNGIYTVKDSNGVTYHVLCSDIDAKFINKREAVRVPLDSTLTLCYNGKSCFAKARDLSALGIAFYIDSMGSIDLGTELICKFEKFYCKYSIRCHVVRIVEQDNGKFLVGCEFINSHQAVNELINDIQLQHRRTNKRKVVR